MFTDNYEKARNIAKKAEETSNVESDEERPRKRQPPSRFSSSDDGKLNILFFRSISVGITAEG